MEQITARPSTSARRWELLIVQFPDDPDIKFTPEQIAPVIGLQENTVRRHLRALFPRARRCEWRLSHAQVLRLLKYLEYAQRKVPSPFQ